MRNSPKAGAKIDIFIHTDKLFKEKYTFFLFFSRNSLYLHADLAIMTNNHMTSTPPSHHTMAHPEDKTLSIVLSTVQLNDHMRLVHLYTQSAGRVTCRVPVASRGHRGSQLRLMMTPMTLLETVFSGRPSADIRSIVEAHVVQSPYSMSLAQPDKATMCLYLAELLSHTIREEEANPRLWQYLTGSLEILGNCQQGWENFHLVFTYGLISLLGFSIDTEAFAEGCCFDMREGSFTRQPILHPYYLTPESSRWFCRLLDTRYGTMHQLELNRQQRAAMLDMLLAFLALQIPEMGKLQSIDVLKSLFD